MITSASRMISGAGPLRAVAGDEAEGGADGGGERDGAGGDHQRVLRRDDDPGEERPAEGVGAEDHQPAVVEGEGREVAAAQVLLGRGLAEQRRAEERAEDHQAEEDHRGGGELVAPEHGEDGGEARPSGARAAARG